MRTGRRLPVIKIVILSRSDVAVEVRGHVVERKQCQCTLDIEQRFEPFPQLIGWCVVEDIDEANEIAPIVRCFVVVFFKGLLVRGGIPTAPLQRPLRIS